MTSTATAPRTRAPESTLDCAGVTLADEHQSLLRGVQRRAAAVEALIDARTWPHSELATLTGFLRATLLRQVSDEERLLYPHDVTATPFADLSAAHAHLYELTYELDEIRGRRCSLPHLRDLVNELLTRLGRHLTEEEAVLATVTESELDVPSATTLGERHQHWPANPDDRPLMIQLEALPAAIATQLCLERLLRLQPGEQAIVYSRDRARVYEMRAWLHEFDPARFGLATASDRYGDTRLDVACRDPR